MTIEYSISGTDELRGKLRELSDETQRRGGRAALRKAARIVRDAARRNAEKLDDPETGRMISKNIVERWNGRLNKRTGGAEIGFRVGVQHGSAIGKRNPDQGVNGPTPHWRLLEFGTEKMAAKPFMRPALESNVQAATDEFVREWQKSAERAIKRAQKAKA